MAHHPVPDYILQRIIENRVVDHDKRHYEIDPKTGCWNWQLSKNKGYGQMGWYVDKKCVTGKAHRISYQAFKGPIPNNLPLDHTCRNRSCINPDHLEAVTQRENILRAYEQDSLPQLRTHPPTRKLVNPTER